MSGRGYRRTSSGPVFHVTRTAVSDLKTRKLASVFQHGGSFGTAETGTSYVQIRLNFLAHVFAGDVVDDLNLFGGSGAIAHHNHRPSPAIFQLVKRAAGDGRNHPGLQNCFATIRKMHRAFAVD